MMEVDEQNRNVHGVPQACNWQADEQPAEMWRKARPFGPCALQSCGNRVKVLVATTVVPNELTKEMRELMATTLNVSNVELHQKVESLCLVIRRGQLLFIKFPVRTEQPLEFFVSKVQGANSCTVFNPLSKPPTKALLVE